MIKPLRTLITASLAALSAGACSSAPSMDLNAPVPTEADAICAVRHPCGKVPAPTAEDTELCTAIFSDMSAECRTENVELFVCSMRAARCDASGDIDDEATMSSLMKNCDAARLKLERCCESTGNGDNVHCGLFREEGDPVGDDEGVEGAEGGEADEGGDVAPADE